MGDKTNKRVREIEDEISTLEEKIEQKRVANAFLGDLRHFDAKAFCIYSCIGNRARNRFRGSFRASDADTLVDTVDYQNRAKSNIRNQETKNLRARKQTLTEGNFTY